MYKYIKYYDLGYNDGIICAFKDILLSSKRVYERINSDNIKARLYDIGFFDGYNITYKKLTLKSL